MWSFVTGIRPARFIQVICVSALHCFQCQIIFHCMDAPCFTDRLIHQSMHICYFFCFLLIMNSTATIVGAQVFVWIYVFIFLGLELLGHMPLTIFDLLKTCQTVSQSKCSVLHSHKQCVRARVSSHSVLFLLPLPVFFYYSHPSGREVVLHCSFGLHFPDGLWYSVCWLLAQYVFCGEMSIQILFQFLNWVIFFYD